MNAAIIIVLSDDIPDVLESYAVTIHNADPLIVVRTATSMEETLLKCQQIELAGDKVSAAVLDLNLGDTNGVETLEVFSKAYPKIPIIALTGSPQSGEDESLRAGAREYILKASEDAQGCNIVRIIRRAILRMELWPHFQPAQNSINKTTAILEEMLLLTNQTNQVTQPVITQDINGYTVTSTMTTKITPPIGKT